MVLAALEQDERKLAAWLFDWLSVLEFRRGMAVFNTYQLNAYNRYDHLRIHLVSGKYLRTVNIMRE